MRARRWLLATAGVLATTTALGISTSAAAPATSTVAPAAAPLAAPGPHQVGIRTLDVGADLPPLTHWYPAAPGTDGDPVVHDQEFVVGGPLGSVTVGRVTGTAVRDAARADVAAGPPLVVIAPGYGIGAEAYSWLAEHLASHGFAVVAHGPQETLASAMGDGLWQAVVDRPATLAEVVTTLRDRAAPGSVDAGAWDPDRIALVGHSFGGFAALDVAGARLDTDAFTTRCDDGDPDATWLCDVLQPAIPAIATRAGLDTVPDGVWPDHHSADVDAVVALAGDAYLFDTRGLASLTAPLLAIGGSEDTDTPWALGPALAIDGASSDQRVLVELEGAEHLVFTGRCDRVRRMTPLVPMDLCEDADGDRATRHDVIAHVTTAFLLDALTDAGTPAAHGIGRGPALPGTTIHRHGGDND